MKFLIFLITFSISVGAIVFLNKKHGDIPPMGKFLNPFSGFWQNADKTLIPQPDTLQINGLSEEVTIKYDKHQIPHIFANNNRDLYIAAGYVTASNRLWQMEISAFNAAGRLCEIVGDRAIRLDRLTRRRGTLQAAENMLIAWEEDSTINEILEAYTIGVNAYISGLEYKNFPIEYKLLDYQPELWDKLKVVLMSKNMSAMLTLGEADMENTNIRDLYGSEVYQYLFPDREEEISPIIPAGTKWNFKPMAIDTNKISDTQLPVNLTRPDKLPDESNGSNNWVVSGKKTASGKPMLANDMHLGLNLPAIWYQMQLQTPDFNVFGHNLPGTPLIITGCNDSIAWGFTNSQRDMVDWYNIQFKDENRNEYRYEEQWLPTRKYIEEIKIRNQETYYDTIIYTHYGPVVYDSNFSHKEGINLAMKWIAHEITYEPRTFAALASAANYNDFKEAIRHFSNPPQNIAFASASGDIAMHVQGKMPLRKKDQGKFVFDGAESKNEWMEFIPTDHYPSIANPTQGFLSSANQHQTDETYPYSFYHHSYEYYRNRRINNRLSEMRNISPQDMMQLQMDNYSLKAAEYLPIFLDSLWLDSIDTNSRNYYFELRKWNFNYDANSKAAVYFDVWWAEFHQLLWAEFQNDSVSLRKPNAYHSYRLILKHPEVPLINYNDPAEIKSISALATRAYLKMAERVAEWESSNTLNWQNFKATKIEHLAGIEPFGRYNVQIGGTGDAINAVKNNHGPSQRLIVAFENEVKIWSNYAGGQSGNPGNKGYDHFVDDWAAGKYHQILFLKSKEQQHSDLVFTQTLLPASTQP
ncbi:MAG: penicillin acylase family protein [Cyclobacteriaceae bacterium]